VATGSTPRCTAVAGMPLAGRGASFCEQARSSPS
jgi:hypothetical protein